MNKIDLECLAETEDAMMQREGLRRVKEFLQERGADEELIDTIDIAVEDIERWICPKDEQVLLGCGGKIGSA